MRAVLWVLGGKTKLDEVQAVNHLLFYNMAELLTLSLAVIAEHMEISTAVNPLAEPPIPAYSYHQSKLNQRWGK